MSASLRECTRPGHVEKRTTLNSDTCLSLTRNVTPSHRNLHALIGQPVLCRHVSCVTRDKDFRRTRKLDARFSPTQTGARKHRALSSHFVPSSHSLTPPPHSLFPFLPLPLLSRPSAASPLPRSLPPSFMAPKQPCAKYQYIVTSAGPKIVPVPDSFSKDEESPADYNSGGYLPVKVRDTFKDGRYHVLRKLGYASPPFSSCFRSFIPAPCHLCHIS